MFALENLAEVRFCVFTSDRCLVLWMKCKVLYAITAWTVRVRVRYFMMK